MNNQRFLLTATTLLSVLCLATGVYAENAKTPASQGSGRGRLRGITFKPLQKDPSVNLRNTAPQTQNCGLKNISKPLTVLALPRRLMGLTVAEYPKFFVYIPAPTAQPIRFVLQERDNTPIYETALAMPRQSSVFSFSLPKTLPPLEVGKLYFWSFKLVCNVSDRSRDILLEGVIKRTEPNPHLLAQLQKASPMELPVLYAEAGFWHEALATLAELRRSYPKDSVVISAWERLLQSVGLGAVAKEPLVLEQLTPIKLETTGQSNPQPGAVQTPAQPAGGTRSRGGFLIPPERGTPSNNSGGIR